jgi:hypothetical protein
MLFQAFLGNSGGPVVNADGRVVAIVTSGRDGRLIPGPPETFVTSIRDLERYGGVPNLCIEAGRLARIVTKQAGPTTIATGKVFSVPLTVGHGGRVEVVIDRLDPDWTGHSGPKGLPGQDGLYVTICASQAGRPCSSRQLGVSQAFSEVLPDGPATISVFNFATSPRMTFSLSIKYPE